MSSDMEQQHEQVQWRRDKVQELCSKGYSQREISQTLQIGYEKCLVGLNAITREAWNTAQNTEDQREKIQALYLAKECYSMKLDLLTNATVVDDAIRFVSDKSKDKDREQVKSSPSFLSDSSNELSLVETTTSYHFLIICYLSL
ncbi:MAG TPA: hypothetical protein VI033_05760 [Candidatus Nitrosopolaris sp.]